jgi:hypothetical protein
MIGNVHANVSLVYNNGILKTYINDELIKTELLDIYFIYAIML